MPERIDASPEEIAAVVLKDKPKETLRYEEEARQAAQEGEPSMTVDEAARILREMYDAGATRGRGRMTTAIHLFGIRYADDLSRLSIREILVQARLSHTYQTEVNKGIRLAEYVKVVNDFP